ncbi:hypothetical protein AB6A40_010398 [Gnathostoma spinigerum]|uniref:Secreted protein n=1 Tax=Gnathostoma spinigerum TaxID=75299 RepID=A0ABD6F1G8_9BILA
MHFSVVQYLAAHMLTHNTLRRITTGRGHSLMPPLFGCRLLGDELLQMPIRGTNIASVPMMPPRKGWPKSSHAEKCLANRWLRMKVARRRRLHRKLFLHSNIWRFTVRRHNSHHWGGESTSEAF